ncbi:MAG: hypothetical protein ACERKD_09025 [Prolixibacteraceae bacterium]
MKTNILPFYFACTLLFVLFHISSEAKFVSDIAVGESVNEQLYMSLDRNIYCVDETVYFRIFNTSDAVVKENEWSSIVNVELITPNGQSIVAGKFPFSSNGASGSLLLPKNILSGNYYLRAYTKWMRNQPANSYFYVGISIVNPFKHTILMPGLNNQEQLPLKVDTLLPIQNQLFELSKLAFDRNQLASLNIHSLSENGITDFCLSLVKKGTVKQSVLDLKYEGKMANDITYVPEVRGVSLSGSVLNKLDSLPIGYAKVWVTLQDKNHTTRDVMCDEKGAFNIDFGKNEGTHNLYINASSAKENVVPIVMIDNDFSFSTLNLPYQPFTIPDDEKTWFEDFSINSQLSHFYKSDPTKTIMDSAVIDPNLSFYGRPDFTLALKDFISLPTIEDYFKELVPMVNVKKEGGRKSFHVLGIYPELYIYDPLVMVDRVKINDVDGILGISPSSIDRIEVVLVPFLRGDVTYGGIIHFISKVNDFAQIELPDESLFVTYRLIDSLKSASFQEPVAEPLPFIGNILFWESSASFNDANNLSIQFNTGSEPGTYQLKLEGINQEKQVIQFNADIEIK